MDLRGIKEFIIDSMSWVATFIIVILFFIYIISIQTVTGNSMHPTYKNGNLVVVNKLVYKYSEPKRFDVVTVEDDDGKTYIKRIIGVPGDNVSYLDNKLYINDIEVEEPFKNNSKTNNFFLVDVCPKKCSNNKIPKNEYLLLGDNREDSFDSRDITFGLRKKGSIKGKILFKIFSF